MPRPRKSPTTLVVNYFMSAPVGEARQALEIAGAIVTARSAGADGNGAVPRRRRGSKAAGQTRVDPHSGIALSGTIAPATPAVTAPTPRRRRGPGRPPVTELTPVTGPSLPPQLAPGEE